MAGSAPPIEALRAELLAAASLPGEVERTLAALGVVTAAFRPWSLRPVLVGGMAVWFWAETERFETIDIDVVVDAPPAAERVLEQLGFVRSVDGMHWELPGTQLILEIPERRLDPGSEVVEVVTAPDRAAYVLSLADVLVVRLQEFQGFGHDLVALQCMALIAQAEREDWPRLALRAKEGRVSGLLTALADLNRRIAVESAEFPDGASLRELARHSRSTDLGLSR